MVAYTLFEVPPGWEVGETKLKQMASGRNYRLTLATLHEANLHVDFTAKDLGALAEDEVLVANGDGHEKVNRARFESNARESCPRDKATPSKIDVDELKKLINPSAAPSSTPN